MKMTLDEAIRYLKYITEELVSPSKTVDVITFTMDTMKKYQKIIDIIEYGRANELECDYVLDEIREVIGDVD